MLRESLKDNAEILDNILNQPLEIRGLSENISLLQAVKNFSGEQAEHSDLAKMLHTFASNPENTEILIQELNLIMRDLAR